MIEIAHGNILKANTEALVNTVNCVGVMGRGVALQFRKAFPENFKVYKTICDEKKLHPGVMMVHDLGTLTNPRYIINFPTKHHWKGKSRIEDIEIGLKALVEEVHKLNIKSIAIPPLGCGLGGLEWEDVRARIEETFRNVSNVQVLLYEPVGAPSVEGMAKSKGTPNMTVGRASLLGLMQRYLAAAMDPVISLLEIHKLMYFMQEAGEKLNLRYQKAIYGPYAVNLRHVLSHIEGHFISGYGDAEDRPNKQITLESEASRLADDFLKHHHDTHNRFDRVANLIKGFETPLGMELLSTVHWVAIHEGASNANEAIAKTYAWNKRKQMFQAAHIRIAWDVLAREAWLKPTTDHGHH